MKVFIRLVKRWEKDLYLQLSQNIMERGLSTGDMHITTLIVLGQWVGDLLGRRQHPLILNSSTKISKISYLKLRLISYCNFLLSWLRTKNVLCSSSIMIFLQTLRKIQNHSQKGGLSELATFFLLPLGHSAWRQACGRMYFSTRDLHRNLCI